MNLFEQYPSLLKKNVSLFEFLRLFGDETECLNLYFRLKFEGHSCSKCGRSVVDNYKPTQERKFRCRSCKTDISPLSDTIFRGSNASMSDIFRLVYSLSHPTSSASHIGLERETGISRKTVHRLTMLIRKLLVRPVLAKMSGSIEIDEVFLGKGSKVWNWGSISTRKQPIIGMICRETKEVRVFLVNDRKASTIYRLVKDNVLEGTTIYTDGWRGYLALGQYYKHASVDHSSREFVRGDVHTNTIENFWGRIKRNLRKEHVKITAKFVQMYVNEQVFRNNSRGKPRMQVFDEILRLTFFSSNSGSCPSSRRKSCV